MCRIACFGEALVDFLALPAPDAGTPRAFAQHAGGAPANVAVALARLGSEAEFIGTLAHDMFGGFLHDALRTAGVRLEHVQWTTDAPTALAFVALDRDGERSFSFYRPPAADLLFDAAALAADAFDGLRVLHACSNSLTEPAIAAATQACLQRARAAGALVTFDMNLRPALWPRGADPAPRIRAAIEQADVVKLAADELDFLAVATGSDGNAAIDALLGRRARLVVVTDGARPLRWFTRECRGTLAPPPVRAIDTTAAGDAFCAGLLHELVRHGIDPRSLDAFAADAAGVEAALRFAAACGALAVTRHGAFDAMPARGEVLELLRNAPADEVRA